MREPIGLVEDDVGDVALRIQLHLATDAEDIADQPLDPVADEAGHLLLQPAPGPNEHIVGERPQRDDDLLGGKAFLAAFGDPQPLLSSLKVVSTPPLRWS